LKKHLYIIFLLQVLTAGEILGQACTTLGQTPSTAFPVCGTTLFKQNTVPLCRTNDIFVPGCSGDGAQYANRNPFFYIFTCYTSGSLGFTITPLANNEDYDWQLYDITGRNPDDIFIDHALVVTGNWAGTYGPTGASATGVNFIQCASSPPDNKSTFAAMPPLIAGHTYLLMVSHFTDTQSGYTLQFSGGTAVITDPTEPHMQEAKPGCDGKTITLKLNKKIKCSSLTNPGSEFSIFPAVTTVVSAAGDSCSLSFDVDEINISLAAPLTNNTYQLIINKGSDGNTLLDNCDRPITAGETVTFTFNQPIPIFADSIGSAGCAPDELNIYFPKKILCSTIATDGSDFRVTGPSPVSVSGASGNCVNGLTGYVTVKLASPVVNKGTYQLTLKAGVDGSTVIDECGVELPVQTMDFTAADTVSADFTYTNLLGCRFDTLEFMHSGANDVNKWTWNLNGSQLFTRNHTAVLPAASVNNISLIVTNGVCSDTSSQQIILDNEVIAAFGMPGTVCPEDPLIVTDSSRGIIDSWRWSIGNFGTSTLQDPGPIALPRNDAESLYPVRLTVSNTTLGCTDTVSKILRVLKSCFIAVPTAFTPNGDGLNDFLFPLNALKADNLVFKVYNRWGQLVFAGKNWQDKWDGRVNGILQGTGVYVWFLSYTHHDTGKEVFQKGTSVLIR